MNFDEKYEALLKEYEAKYTLPNWFVSGFKTLISKNITLEDWNKMYVNLERLASDSAVLMKILKLYKSELVASSTLDNYYTKDKVYPKEKVYTKDEVYNKKETYAKTETYAKNEVYPKNEVYTKPETFSREEAMSLGLIQIKEYDSETGTVEIVYDPDVLSVAYNEETGELLFYYKTSTLDTDDEIPDIPSGGGTVEVDLSKYQTKKISAFVSGPLVGFDTVEDSLNEINKSLEALDNVDTSILDGSVSVGSAKSDELGNSIHATYATLKALNETKSEISKLISNAPESFDTLKENAFYSASESLPDDEKSQWNVGNVNSKLQLVGQGDRPTYYSESGGSQEVALLSDVETNVSGITLIPVTEHISGDTYIYNSDFNFNNLTQENWKNYALQMSHHNGQSLEILKPDKYDSIVNGENFYFENSNIGLKVTTSSIYTTTITSYKTPARIILQESYSGSTYKYTSDFDWTKLTPDMFNKYYIEFVGYEGVYREILKANRFLKSDASSQYWYENDNVGIKITPSASERFIVEKYEPEASITSKSASKLVANNHITQSGLSATYPTINKSGVYLINVNWGGEAETQVVMWLVIDNPDILFSSPFSVNFKNQTYNQLRWANNSLTLVDQSGNSVNITNTTITAKLIREY